MSAQPADIAAATRAAILERFEDTALRDAVRSAQDGSLSPGEGFFDLRADADAVVEERGATLAGKLTRDLWLSRHFDSSRGPAATARQMMLCFSAAGVLRFGGEAAALWGWDPTNSAATLAAAQAKRLLDPIAAPLFYCAMGIWVLSERNLLAQLRTKPQPLNMWAKLPQLKRPALVIILSFGAAIGVVITR